MAVKYVRKRCNKKDRNCERVAADAEITLGDLGQKHDHKERYDKNSKQR